MDGPPRTTETLRFGPFELDVQSRELRTGQTRVRLQDQPFEILRMMLERPGRVVTREELQSRLWPNGTFVDIEHSLNAAVKRLRAALGDEADNPRFVETLPRRGYRLIVKVSDTEPAIDSLAVLPLLNAGGSADTEYLSDGLTEHLINNLSRLRDLRVMSRNSVLSYKGQEVDAQTVGNTLHVRSVLIGQVTTRGDALSISVELVDARDKSHIWGEHYNRKAADLLAVQS